MRFIISVNGYGDTPAGNSKAVNGERCLAAHPGYRGLFSPSVTSKTRSFPASLLGRLLPLARRPVGLPACSLVCILLQALGLVSLMRCFSFPLGVTPSSVFSRRIFTWHFFFVLIFHSFGIPFSHVFPFCVISLSCRCNTIPFVATIFLPPLHISLQYFPLAHSLVFCFCFCFFFFLSRLTGNTSRNTFLTYVLLYPFSPSFFLTILHDRPDGYESNL